MMELETIIDILEKHNKWRRGDDSIEMMNPSIIGEAIDEAIRGLKSTYSDGVKQGLMIAEILVSFNYDDICRSDDPAAYVTKLIENENKTI
jgi:hypothetical protein